MELSRFQRAALPVQTWRLLRADSSRPTFCFTVPAVGAAAKTSQTCQVAMSWLPLGPCVATRLSHHVTPPTCSAFCLLSRKRVEKIPPEVNFA